VPHLSKIDLVFAFTQKFNPAQSRVEKIKILFLPRTKLFTKGWLSQVEIDNFLETLDKL